MVMRHIRVAIWGQVLTSIEPRNSSPHPPATSFAAMQIQAKMYQFSACVKRCSYALLVVRRPSRFVDDARKSACLINTGPGVSKMPWSSATADD